MVDGTAVTMWFDPSCPLSRITARWLAAAGQARGFAPTWEVMSLTLLNAGLAEDPEGDPEGYLLIPARIAALIRAEHGSEALHRFHNALWADTERSGGDWIGDLRAALEAAGLPPETADAGGSGASGPTGIGADDPAGRALRASHRQARTLAPGDAGSPVIAARTADRGTTAFFGPVLDAPPDGEDAGRLWDAVLATAATPGFRELKVTAG